MLFEYFKEFNARIVKQGAAKKTASKKKAAAKKGASKKASAKKSQAKATSFKLDKNKLQEGLEGIIPMGLNITDANPLDSNGFSPDGADFCIYRPHCRDIVSLMGGYIPQELLQGTVFTTDSLNKKTLQELLNRVAAVKKINRLSTEEEEESFNVPSFIIAGGGDYGMMDLKNDILNAYMNNNVDESLKFEILMVVNQGIVIRDWHTKSYVSLETGEDTMLYFFILMNEYLEAERDGELDFRKYVKTDKSYNEY